MMMAKPPRSSTTKLRIVSSSDNHLYHPRVPIHHTIESVDQIIAEDEHAAGIDMLIFAGDVFDRAVPFGDDSVRPLIAWMVRLLKFCEKYDIVLRILYGTPRHDRKQSARFQDLIEELGITVDFKYVSVLSIEFISRFGINVLYIPDEWRTDNAVTLQEVRQLMAEHHLDKVDFAVMHGCFGFQLPPIESAQLKAHDTQAYLDLVRHQIFIGHHHVFSTFKHICAHGSTTRLAQGEEGPKGYVVFDLEDDDSWKLTFVENTLAWTFKRLSVNSWTYADTVAFLRSEGYREGSYIDLEAEQDSEVSQTFKEIRGQFSHLNLRLVRAKKKEIDESKPDLKDTLYVSRQISENNVADAVTEWLSRKNIAPALLERCREAVENVKRNID